MKTRIKATNINLTPYLEKLVKEKMADIAKILRGETVLIAEIEIGITNKHHQKGDIYRSEIQIEVPGKLFRAVSEKEDFRSSLTDAKKEIEEQIIKHKDKKITKKKKVIKE
jgi:ribosomal subunit interface protein